jgi:hypothetical protein
VRGWLAPGGARQPSCCTALAFARTSQAQTPAASKRDTTRRRDGPCPSRALKQCRGVRLDARFAALPLHACAAADSGLAVTKGAAAGHRLTRAETLRLCKESCADTATKRRPVAIGAARPFQRWSIARGSESSINGDVEARGRWCPAAAPSVTAGSNAAAAQAASAQARSSAIQSDSRHCLSGELGLPNSQRVMSR